MPVKDQLHVPLADVDEAHAARIAFTRDPECETDLPASANPVSAPTSAWGRRARTATANRDAATSDMSSDSPIAHAIDEGYFNRDEHEGDVTDSRGWAASALRPQGPGKRTK